MIDIERVLDFINKEVPGHAEELWAAIDLLENTIENTRCAIDGTIGKLSSNRNYSKASEYIQMSQEIASIIDIIKEYNKKFILAEDENVSLQTEDEEDDELEKENKINYEDYRVDEEISYNLYTDFTHKKPAAFSLEGKKYYARKWQYVFIQTCEILKDKNEDIFSSFAYDVNMQGRTRAYFSNNKEQLRKPRHITGTDIFVETNLSANTIRNIIINMLEKYNIAKNNYQLYLSKDLTPLHSSYTEKSSRKNDVVDTDEESHT